MKTHKNPALRQGPAPFRPTGTAPKTAPKPSAKPTPVQSHPPVTELQGKKWVVVSISHITMACLSILEMGNG